MKSLIRSCLLVRLAVFSGLWSFVPLVAVAHDPAAVQLQATGSVPVKNAGPYVEVGTLRIQVASKLGNPSLRLGDGSWVYENFVVNDSDAHGALVVRFVGGAVCELSLVTPVTLTALQATPKAGHDKTLLAAQSRR